MPRLSLWREEQHSNDYQFIDRRIHEMFTIGGTGIYIHKYLGTFDQNGTNDATNPTYQTESEKNIQDLLFLENRDRKYAQNVYNMRGIYNLADIDFDLSQWGLYLQNDTIFITFHVNDMIAMMDRKLLSGDVLELPHLKEYFPLDSGLPTSLPRYYVVQDGSYAAEGYSPTWWPHLWRVKCTPLVDGQEFRDILGDSEVGSDSLRDLLSTYQEELDNNSAILSQAEAETPKSGYETDQFYVVSIDKETGEPIDPEISPQGNFTKELQFVGDGLAPNGFPVTPGIAFPSSPAEGDYVLRLDYKPNRLYRWNGTYWIHIEDDIRANYSPGQTLPIKHTFVNNNDTTTLSDGTIIPTKQSLSDALKPKSDVGGGPDGPFALEFSEEFN